MIVVNLSIAALLLGLTSFWLAFNIRRTSRERSLLLVIMESSDGPRFWIIAKVLEDIKFDEHFWARMRCENPWPLYPPHIRELVGK
jgi:hypothetical protein